MGRAWRCTAHPALCFKSSCHNKHSGYYDYNLFHSMNILLTLVRAILRPNVKKFSSHYWLVCLFVSFLGVNNPTIDNVSIRCPPTGYGPSAKLITVQRLPPEIPVLPDLDFHVWIFLCVVTELGIQFKSVPRLVSCRTSYILTALTSTHSGPHSVHGSGLVVSGL